VPERHFCEGGSEARQWVEIPTVGTLKVFGSTFLQKGAKKATFYKKSRKKRCEKGEAFLQKASGKKE